MNATLDTFSGRKQMEMQAWRLAQDAFSRIGFRLFPLGLDRSIFGSVNEVLSRPNFLFPHTAFLLASIPDGLVICQRSGKIFPVELKSSCRPSVAVRLRDLVASILWGSLLVFADLKNCRLYASLPSCLSPPRKIIVPDVHLPPTDKAALSWIVKQFPETPVICCEVSHGSQMPFAIWNFEQFPKLEVILIALKVLFRSTPVLSI